MSAGEENIATPGEILGDSSQFIAGKGTYLAPNGRNIHASLTGQRRLVPPPPDSAEKHSLWNPSLQRLTVEVVGHKTRGAVPEPGVVVIARVTRVMARMASADIMCVESKAVKEKFTGIIRQQDVRATEIDKVDMYQSFRPGDIVKAEVLSLGDARAYYLSTAKNELGVVSAQSIAGATMVPISWTDMQCPSTGQVEKRKVAKVL
ncbi:exosome complex component CSL4 isoform X1 [Dendrobium catenatum]|uniref:exosome complex component CSL4 isoform X1 n=1 Tax=Dendrobium catenatum TaxID=906689 RepID=UPI00109F0722|nr:exosome complex component CSL4 isoform X1 [Dendrobium catenatum]